MTVKEVILHIKKLQGCLVSAGRLCFLDLLLNETMSEKLERSRKGFIYIDFSLRMESLLIKSLGQKKKTVKWDEHIFTITKEIIETCNVELCENLQWYLESKAHDTIHYLIGKAKNDILLVPVAEVLNELKDVVKNNSVKAFTIDKIDITGSSAVERVFFGPAKIKEDKIFDTSYNDVGYTLPENGNTLEEIVPSCWSVAQGELRACELCALSVIEYDNLPLQFYWDFSKQSWDEARHALIYLNLSLSFFDTVITMIEKTHPLYKIIKSFKENKSGLPLPKDRNTWDAIINAELEERIILLNILTEGPAVARLTHKIKKEICTRYPQIKRVLEYDKADEMFHARIGNYWLKYLIPNLKSRKQKIEDAKLMKGFLLLTSIVEYSKGNMNELARELVND